MFVMLLAPAVTPPATAALIPTPVTIRDAPRVNGERISPAIDVIPPASPMTTSCETAYSCVKMDSFQSSATALSSSSVL